MPVGSDPLAAVQFEPSTVRSRRVPDDAKRVANATLGLPGRASIAEMYVSSAARLRTHVVPASVD